MKTEARASSFPKISSFDVQQLPPPPSSSHSPPHTNRRRQHIHITLYSILSDFFLLHMAAVITSSTTATFLLNFVRRSTKATTSAASFSSFSATSSSSSRLVSNSDNLAQRKQTNTIATGILPNRVIAVTRRGSTSANNYSTSSSPKQIKIKDMTTTAVETTTTTNQTGIPDIEDYEVLHQQALDNCQTKYIDPTTGYTVFTELIHLKRGTCCGNQCRHCPYGWENVIQLNVRNKVAKLQSGDYDTAQRMVQDILNKKKKKENNSTSRQDDEHESLTNGKHPITTTNGKNHTTTKNSNTDKNVADSTPPPPPPPPPTTMSTTTTNKNVPYTRQGDLGTSQLATDGILQYRRRKDDIAFEALGTIDELCAVVGVVHAQLLQKQQQKIDIDSNGGGGGGGGTPCCEYGDLPEWLLDVMSRLFDIGSHIAKPVVPAAAQAAATNSSSSSSSINKNDDNNNDNDNLIIENNNNNYALDPIHITQLEDWINIMTEEMPELTSFILPTGSVTSAQLHVARTVCRRAERRLVPWLLQHDGGETGGGISGSTSKSNSRRNDDDDDDDDGGHDVDSKKNQINQFDGRDPCTLKYVNRLSDFLFTAARWVNYCEGNDEVLYRQPNVVVGTTTSAADDTAAKGSSDAGTNATTAGSTTNRTRVTRSLRED